MKSRQLAQSQSFGFIELVVGGGGGAAPTMKHLSP